MNRQSIKSRSNLPDILSRLDNIVIRDANDSISWNAIDLDEINFELIFCLEFIPKVDDHLIDEMLWVTVNDCAKAKNFSERFFLRSLRDFLSKYQSRKVSQYKYFCQINCESNIALPNKLRPIHGTIKFNKSTPGRLASAIKRLSEAESRKLALDDHFQFLTGSVQAKDDRAAIDIAYRDIKFTLGLMNILSRGYGPTRRFGYPSNPIGRFLTTSTIFTTKSQGREIGGFMEAGSFPWNFRSSFRVWANPTHTDPLSFYKNYRTDINKSDFSELVIQSIILFQEGVETTNTDLSLIKLWTGIELLCSKDQKESSENVIVRASSIFINRKNAEIRLRYINEYRNKLVHKGITGEHAVLCAQYASTYLATLIKFFLYNKYKLRSRSDIISYMSTATDLTKLKKEISLRNLRMKSLVK